MWKSRACLQSASALALPHHPAHLAVSSIDSHSRTSTPTASLINLHVAYKGLEDRSISRLHVHCTISMETATAIKFQHEPLDHNRGSTCLIHVLPELSQDELVQCVILHETTWQVIRRGCRRTCVLPKQTFRYHSLYYYLYRTDSIALNAAISI